MQETPPRHRATDEGDATAPHTTDAGDATPPPHIIYIEESNQNTARRSETLSGFFMPPIRCQTPPRRRSTKQHPAAPTKHEAAPRRADEAAHIRADEARSSTPPRRRSSTPPRTDDSPPAPPVGVSPSPKEPQKKRNNQ